MAEVKFLAKTRAAPFLARAAANKINSNLLKSVYETFIATYLAAKHVLVGCLFIVLTILRSQAAQDFADSTVGGDGVNPELCRKIS